MRRSVYRMPLADAAYARKDAALLVSTDVQYKAIAMAYRNPVKALLASGPLDPRSCMVTPV